MKKELQYASLILFLAQLLTLVYILSQWLAADNGWARLGWFFFGSMVLVWFVGLMVFTFLVWYKSNEKNRKRDFYALVIVGTLTFFSVMITFGWIS